MTVKSQGEGEGESAPRLRPPVFPASGAAGRLGGAVVGEPAQRRRRGLLDDVGSEPVRNAGGQRCLE